MSDKLDETMAAPDENPINNSLGAVLSATREQHQLSIDDVSSHLRLSPRQIMALESNDFAALPEAMITRGFIRNYARLLGIDAEPLLQAYREYAPSAEYAISIPSANIPILNNNKRSWKPYFIASLIVVILLGLWLAYMDYFSGKFKQSPFSSTLSSMMAPATTTAMPQPAALPPVAPIAETVTPPAPAPAQPSAASAAAEPAAATEPSESVEEDAVSTIKLSFTGSSWVSVTDASNKKILNATKSAGEEAVVQGDPPFKIIIGNAGASSLLYNDKPVDLAPYTKLNVARITLE